MATASSLTERIDAEFSAAEARLDQFRAQRVQEYQDRQKRLERFDQTTVDVLRKTWESRLEVLAKRFGQRMDVHPTVEPGRKSVTLEFQSTVARVQLRFSAAPDAEVRKLVVCYDVTIVPSLMKFESHDELEAPLDAIDGAQLAEWLDNRIVDFVHTYLAIHENPYYLMGQMVQDPIANVKFPKFAAAAQLEQNGKTIYFLDESTLCEFQKRNSEAREIDAIKG